MDNLGGCLTNSPPPSLTWKKVLDFRLGLLEIALSSKLGNMLNSEMIQHSSFEMKK